MKKSTVRTTSARSIGMPKGICATVGEWMHVWMWVDGWMWMNGWMWVDGWMWMNGWMWMDELMVTWMDVELS